MACICGYVIYQQVTNIPTKIHVRYRHNRIHYTKITNKVPLILELVHQCNGIRKTARDTHVAINTVRSIVRMGR